MTIAKMPAVRDTMDTNVDWERCERSTMGTNEPEEVKVNNKENDDGDEPETDRAVPNLSVRRWRGVID